MRHCKIRGACLFVLLASAAACASDGTQDSETEGAQDPESGSEMSDPGVDCIDGTQECPCLLDELCDSGLVCGGGICLTPEDAETSAGGLTGDFDDLDLDQTDTPDPPTPQACDPAASSYLWVPDSAAGELVKIDPDTLSILARYKTGPYPPSTGPLQLGSSQVSGGYPSAVSVSGAGSVAVANRLGGSLAKLATVPERCSDLNGDGVVSTSSGPDDVLPWGEDECVLGFFEADHGLARPYRSALAWRRPDLSADRCVEGGLWATQSDALSPEDVHVEHLDGQSLELVSHLVLQGAASGSVQGVASAASDRLGNLWLAARGGRSLYIIDAETLEYEEVEAPGSIVGLAVDYEARAVMSTSEGNLLRYDQIVEQWDLADVGVVGSVAVDRRGVGEVWVSGLAGSDHLLRSVDIETMGVSADSYVVSADPDLTIEASGVAADWSGHVWIVGGGTDLHRYSLETESSDILRGLEDPHVNGDFSGYGMAVLMGLW